jgi:hypothetical protein
MWKRKIVIGEKMVTTENKFWEKSRKIKCWDTNITSSQLAHVSSIEKLSLANQSAQLVPRNLIQDRTLSSEQGIRVCSGVHGVFECDRLRKKVR